jgi:hypothetical protein
MPGRKTDINNSGPFHRFYWWNFDYSDANYEERKKIIESINYTRRALLLGNDIRVPEHLRNEMRGAIRKMNTWLQPAIVMFEARRMENT